MPKIIDAAVTAFPPDFFQVRLESKDGHKYAVGRQTGGIPWDQLEEGQRIRCVVTTDPMARVVEVLEVLG